VVTRAKVVAIGCLMDFAAEVEKVAYIPGVMEVEIQLTQAVAVGTEIS